MLRARKMLGDLGMVDHHADHGFVSSSPVMNYMELYPFINRLWYGEGFDYDTNSADYWLCEIAAFETGVSQDLLRYTTMQHAHGMTRYHYRGMLTASSFRWSGSGVFSPTALWKLWDNFGVENSTMVGWWEEVEQGGPKAVPVHASNPSFKVTSYVKKGVATMIVLADFSNQGGDYNSSVSLANIDWAALGLSAATAKLTAPSLPPFQERSGPSTAEFEPNHVFDVTATQGGLLLLLAAS